MSKKRAGWTYEAIQEIANHFKGRKEFQKGDNRAYQAAQRLGVLDQVCEHMSFKRKDWSDESKIQEEANRYNSRSDFAERNGSAYGAACKIGIDKFCAHMPAKYSDWSDEATIQNAANQYTSRGEFKKGDADAYQAAGKRGILDQVCAHMIAKHADWSDESKIQEIANHFNSRIEFQEGDSNAYQAARRMGILDQVCGHMEPSQAGSSYIATKWIEEIKELLGFHIQYAKNEGEFRIPGTRFKVDGYCSETKTVFEFHGDCWHGNPKIYAPTDTPNPFSKKTAKQLYEDTVKRVNKIKALGYQVVEMWESDYRNQINA
jgi:hypothetical protein